MRERRIVVARRWTGLGDCLVSLLAAHRYAKATNRALVIDWRFTAYAPSDNLFALAFTAPMVWDGVETEVVDAGRGFEISGPTWPIAWTGAMLADAPVAGERCNHAQVVERIASGADVAAPVVVFDGCIAPLAPDAPTSRRLLSSLRVRDDVRDAVERFVRERFAGRPTVGVHVRHGNGGDIGTHAPYWHRPGQALLAIADDVRAAVAALAQESDTPPVVFLSTDSGEIEAMLRRVLPGVVTWPKRFRPAGAGELHLGSNAVEGFVDALVDMLLLGEVDRLVRFPPGSAFSYWGFVMSGRHEHRRSGPRS